MNLEDDILHLLMVQLGLYPAALDAHRFLIEYGGEHTTSQLAAQLGGNRKTVIRRLERLRELGLVHRIDEYNDEEEGPGGRLEARWEVNTKCLRIPVEDFLTKEAKKRKRAFKAAVEEVEAKLCG